MFFLVSHAIHGFPPLHVPLTGWPQVNTRSHKDMLNIGLIRAVGQFLNGYNQLENVHPLLAVDTFFGDGRYKHI